MYKENSSVTDVMTLHRHTITEGASKDLLAAVVLLNMMYTGGCTNKSVRDPSTSSVAQYSQQHPS